MKKLLILLLLTICSMSVMAINECQEQVQINEQCVVITPITVNSSDQSEIYTGDICVYDLYAPNGTKMINDGDLTTGSYGSGRHNFTFQRSVVGPWTIDILCTQGTDYGRISSIITVGYSGTILADIQQRLQNTTDLKADVSSLSTYTQLSTVNTSILAQGDSAWTSADVSSLATSTQLTNVNTSIMTILDTIVADIWAYANRVMTAFNFKVGLNQSGLNDISEIVTRNISNEHGTGAYNSSGTATISDSDKQNIANWVWNDTIVSQDDRTVATNVTATISGSDITTIAARAANQTWLIDGYQYCALTNSTLLTNSTGRMLCDIYTIWGWN